MNTLDDLVMMACLCYGRLPQVGETWLQADGRKVRVVDLSQNLIGPIEARYDDNDHHAGYRTRDGRYAILGRRGDHPRDLTQLVAAPSVTDNDGLTDDHSPSQKIP